MAEALRTLKIKAGIVKRLRNDLEYSRKECENERQRLRKLVDGGADEYEIRAQEKVISDTDQMVPDYQHRLVTAIDDLETLVVGAKLVKLTTRRY